MRRYRCPCCDCHTLSAPSDSCAVCRWDAAAGYSLEEARENVARYGVVYRPSDVQFAIIRHPILGPNGEYAIDRVALRARAYIEFRAFAKARSGSADLTERLQALLQAIRAADSLYTK